MIGVVLVLLAVVGLMRYVDATSYPVVVLQTAGPFVVLGLVLLAAVTLLLRRWWMLLPVGLCLVVAGVLVAPTFVSRVPPASASSTKDLRVMAANLQFGQADAEQVMEAVRYRGVDVLVLTEVTPQAQRALEAAGVDRSLGNKVGEARPDTFTGTLVYSALPLTPVTTDPARDASPSLQPEVIVDVGGVPVRVKGVHPAPPISGLTQRWRAGLLGLQRWVERQPAEERFILAGDFNADAGHPGFRAVADGLVDAHRETGSGWVRTWPVVGNRLPPFVQLDHLLTRGLIVVEAGQTAIHGTDHAMVWASYTVPGADPTP